MIESPESPRGGGLELTSLDLGAIARGGAISLVGLVISLILSFVYQWMLAKALGSAGVGIFTLAVTVTGLVGLIGIFGLDRAIVRFVAYAMSLGDRPKELGAVTSATRLGLLSLAVITPIAFGSADTISRSVFGKPELAPMLRWMTLSVPLLMITRLAMGVLQGYKLIKPIAVIEQIFIPAARIASLSALIYLMQDRQQSAVYSYLLAAMAGCIWAGLVLWRQYHQRSAGFAASPVYRDLILFAMPLLFATLLNRTNTYTETLILGMLSSNEQIGIYTVCFKIAVTLTVFIEAISIPFAPFITETFTRNESSRLSAQFKTVTRWAFMLALPAAIVLLIEAPSVLALFGSDFVAGASVLRILAISQLLYILNGPAGLMLVMTKYNQANLLDLVLTVVLSLVLDFLLIPRYAALGAAIANALTIGLVNLLRLAQVYFLLHIHPYSVEYGKPIMAAGVTALAGVWTSFLLANTFYLWRLIAVMAVCGMVYLALSVTILRVNADRELIMNLVRRYICRASG